MARRIKRKHSKRNFTLPMGVLIGVGAPMISPVTMALKGDINGAFDNLKWKYLGIGSSGNFSFDGLKQGWIPLLMGVAVHKAASYLGVNRALANAGVPVLRL